MDYQYILSTYQETADYIKPLLMVNNDLLFIALVLLFSTVFIIGCIWLKRTDFKHKQKVKIIYKVVAISLLSLFTFDCGIKGYNAFQLVKFEEKLSDENLSLLNKNISLKRATFQNNKSCLWIKENPSHRFQKVYFNNRDKLQYGANDLKLYMECIVKPTIWNTTLKEVKKTIQVSF